MRILMLLAILGAALAVPRDTQRIIGGEVTDIENYPYMANMMFVVLNIGYYQTCGGTLLTNYVVLSAAHCYYTDFRDEWLVRLGSSFASSGGIVHSVSQLILHEDFNYYTFKNDIAIVRLSSAANLNGITVAAARIPSPTYVIPDGSAVTVVGWGNTSHGPGSIAPEQLHHVHVSTINHTLCTERYAYLKTLPGLNYYPDITDAMLCAGILDVGGKDSCLGDSGGPVVQAGDIIVGVISWSYECAHKYYPGVNSRVSYYSNWIQKNAA